MTGPAPDGELPPAAPGGGRGVAKRLRSFVHAGAGLRVLLREQANARIHLLATALVVAAALLLQVDRRDWLILLLCIALVWLAEALNTALEYLADATVQEPHPLIRKAKDVAAAGVLIAAVIAALVGLLLLFRYL